MKKLLLLLFSLCIALFTSAQDELEKTDFWWHGGISNDLNDPLNWTDLDASTDPATPTGKVPDIVRIGAGWGSEDLNSNGVLDPGEDLNANGVIDSTDGLGYGGYYGEPGFGVDLDVDPVLSEEYVSRSGDSTIGWMFIVNAPNILTLEDSALLIVKRVNSNLRNGGRLMVKGRSASGGPSLKLARQFRIAENGSVTEARDDTSKLIINGTGWVQLDPALGGSAQAFFIGQNPDTVPLPRGEILIADSGRLELLPEGIHDDKSYIDFGNKDSLANQIILRDQAQLLLPRTMDDIGRVGANDSVVSLQGLIEMGLITGEGEKLRVIGNEPTIVVAGDWIREVDSIKVTSPGDMVGAGKTLQMAADVYPDTAFYTGVVWSVEIGTGDASISESGLLTGLAGGTVTVVASADDGSGVTGTKGITVEQTMVETITVSASSDSVAIDSTLEMTADVLPDTAYIKEVTWSVTTGTGNATIDTSGILTGVSAGTVTVVATATDGSGVTGTKEITVTSPASSIESQAYSTFKVFPNPSGGIFNIHFAENMQGTVVVYDLTGTAIISQVITGNNYILDLTGNGIGVYFLNITTRDKTEISRLIVY